MSPWLWQRQLRSWELEQAGNLLNLLAELHLNNSRDTVHWEFNKGSFTSKSCYNALLQIDGGNEANWNKIWKIKVPPKIHIFIWKIEHGILPTNYFLHSRLGNTINPNCKRCGVGLETQHHLFWECVVAKQVWQLVIHWWSLDNNQVSLLSSSFWQVLKLFKSCKIRVVWAQVVCSIRWSLWLSRNNLTFNNMRDTAHEIVNLLMYRAFNWCLASKWLSKDVGELWKVNPIGAVLLCSKIPHDIGIIGWNPDFFAYTDDSWVQLRNRTMCGGIGGLLLDADKNTKFVFSGPVIASSPLEVEKLAMLLLFDKVKELISLNRRLLLYKDCLKLVNQAQQIRACTIFLEGDEEWMTLANCPCVKLFHMQREDLFGADKLAKDGRVKNFIHFSWT